MTHEDVMARLKEILQSDFRIPAEKITPEATFRGTLGLDSLDAVDLIYLVGKQFGVKAEVDDFRDLHSVQSVVNFVISAKGKAA
ncbi:MAG: acyl carrier protein [Myxococcaceae bacterium]